MPAQVTKRPSLLKLFILGRSTVASGSLFAPYLFARLFRMQIAGTPAVFALRMFGIRNAVLALGLARLDAFTVPRIFLGLNVVVDAVDAVAIAAAGRRGEISKLTSTLGTTVALSAVVLGAASLAAQPAQQG
ncbi:hypothetical protein AOT83_08770 [Mycobacteroides sp. H001]|jgi:hypothetical protein|uniref:hypothetical protein n=1 Tax=Mycobacteroides TaxID=670516 RepID=UPI0007158DA3|nr:MULTISPECIES: hypothetical protein [Mycobacteroides]KRQ28842.1 hypothetical protein AOT86_06160 [Mycobacteroides sp. H072]KRQ38696.1 hypothetical protein AOT84_09695 [Mycobacteroides sp. H002]KRQ48879.1 hypothetical protein AOT85_17190 [Mycobacteroides sp. H054]KRQ71669.1 hypothetical protein AOT83_08770 [Mycobacteroides sp. H001]OHU36909.1 hypothetical protein BKG79_14790 [Mycobacteroides chelonae]